MKPMNVEIEERLRAKLRQRVDDLPSRSDPYAVVHRRVVRSARRRTAAVVMCAVIVLVTAVVAGPGLLGIGRRATVTDKPPQRVDGSAGSPMEWPTRGALAGDRDYVGRAASWLADRAGTKSDAVAGSDVNVLYAGDVGSKRLAVGAYRRSGGAVRIIGLAGPAGSDQRLKESPMPWSSRSPEFDHLVSFLLPAEEGRRDQRTTVLVLPDSSVRALSYSHHPDIQADGDIRRAWSPLVDEDSEPGVVTAALDGERIAPGALRISAETAGDPVVADQPLDFSDADDIPRTALREMAERAAGDQYLPTLAPALQQLEMADVGWEQITSVRTVWLPHLDDQWTGVEVGLASGGVVQGVLTSSAVTLQGTGMAQESSLYAVQAVPADQAGKEPIFWAGPFGNGCQVWGYVPEQLAATEALDAKVASVDLLIGGEPVGQGAAANGDVVSADYCDVSPKPADGSSVVVRLLDSTGKKLWSGSLAGRFDEYPRALDVQ